MAMTVARLKSILNISGTDYDSDLQMCLQDAHQVVYSSTASACSGNEYMEWHPLTEDGYFYIMGRCNDASVVGLTGYDSAFVGTVIPSGDYAQMGPSLWQFNPSSAWYAYKRYRILYQSDHLTSAIDKLTADIALYEFLKLPGQQGFLTESSKTAGGAVNQSFKTDAEFYDYVDRQLRLLFVPGI
jgi:hypothetical protein